MNAIDHLNTLCCVIIALRVLFYAKPANSQHRPIAAAIAYLVVIGAGCVVLQALFFGNQTTLPELLLNAVFMLSVLACKGNMVHIFHAPALQNSLIFSLIHDCWDTQGIHWHAIKNISNTLKQRLKKEATS